MDELQIVDCPFYWDSKKERCLLPAEVVREINVGGTRVVAILCVLGHYFDGPIEFMWA